MASTWPPRYTNFNNYAGSDALQWNGFEKQQVAPAFGGEIY